jgi:hypothetical protein
MWISEPIIIPLYRVMFMPFSGGSFRSPATAPLMRVTGQGSFFFLFHVRVSGSVQVLLHLATVPLAADRGTFAF